MYHWGVAHDGIRNSGDGFIPFLSPFPLFLVLNSGDIRFLLIPVTWIIALNQSQMLSRKDSNL